MPKPLRKPSVTLHKPSGQARVRIKDANGKVKDHYLGNWGSAEAQDRYDDLIAEWLLRQDVSRFTLAIEEVAILYLDHAAGYYLKAGEPTGEVSSIRAALRMLIAKCGRCPGKVVWAAAVPPVPRRTYRSAGQAADRWSHPLPAVHQQVPAADRPHVPLGSPRGVGAGRDVARASHRRGVAGGAHEGP